MPRGELTSVSAPDAPSPETARPLATAMLLAAGFGLRMRPVTERLPKPLIGVAGRPLIDHAIDNLEACGVERVVINLHHLGDLIRRHLARRKRPRILFSEEPEILETGGGVAKALPLLADPFFLVVNSDIVWLDGPQPALRRLAAAWNPKTMDGLLLLHPTVSAFGYEGPGDFCLDPFGLIDQRPEREISPYLFTGIQVLHRRLFEGAPSGAFGLRLLYDRAIAARRLHGLVHDGEWFHAGSPEGMALAETYFQERYAESKRR
jgi:N-acetyl-alpha-D-muramate 1-phosphate uridylyltransferase